MVYISKEETVKILLRLGKAEYEGMELARPKDVPRTHWIRGAIRKRLEQEASDG